MRAAARASNGRTRPRRRPPRPGDRGRPTWRFPDRATRRSIDGGAASAKFRALLDAGGPIVADGAMGTMLFANGLQFGDPPEVWNLAHPDVIRRIQRGYLEAGSQILLTNTFGGNRARLRLSGHEDRVDELNRTAAILLRAEVDAAGGTRSSRATSGRPARSSSRSGRSPTRRPSTSSASRPRRWSPAASTSSGSRRCPTSTRSRRRSRASASAAPGIALIATMTFDTRGHTMMGVSPGAGRRGARRVGRRRDRRQLRERPRRAASRSSPRCTPRAPDVVLVAKSNAGMPELVDMRAVYRADPETMAAQVVEMRDAGATDRRRLLREHAGPPAGDRRRARRGRG